MPTRNRKKEKVLDIAAINGGDFKFSWNLAQWQGLNVTQADGKVMVKAAQGCCGLDKKSKIPMLEMKMGETGAAIGLFENRSKIQMETSLIPASHV